jgi:hypothetical protein
MISLVAVYAVLKDKYPIVNNVCALASQFSPARASDCATYANKCATSAIKSAGLANSLHTL